MVTAYIVAFSAMAFCSLVALTIVQGVSQVNRNDL
jgi:hypothetical protein